MEVNGLDFINKSLCSVGGIFFNVEEDIFMFGCIKCETLDTMKFSRNLDEILKHIYGHMKSEKKKLKLGQTMEIEKEQEHQPESTQAFSKKLVNVNCAGRASSEFRNVENKIPETTRKRKVAQAAGSLTNFSKDGNLEDIIDLTGDDETLYADSASQHLVVTEHVDPTYNIKVEKSFANNIPFPNRYLQEIALDLSNGDLNSESNRIAHNIDKHLELAASTNDGNNNYIFDEIERKLEEMHSEDEDFKGKKYLEVGSLLPNHQTPLQEYHENNYQSPFSAEQGNEVLSNLEIENSNSLGPLQSIETLTKRLKPVAMVSIPNSKLSSNADEDQFCDLYKKRRKKDDTINQ